MPPTAKEKIAPEGFTPSADGKKVLCALCTGQSLTGKQLWIEWKALTAHMKAASHKRAVEQDRTRSLHAAAALRDQEEDLRRRQEAEVTSLRDVHIPQQQRVPLIPSAPEIEMWDVNPHDAGFDLGMDEGQKRYEALQKDVNRLWNAGTMSHGPGGLLGDENPDNFALDEDDEDDFLAEIMQNAAINDPQNDDILNFQSQDRAEKDLEWSPYATKMLFLLDTLDNLSRLRISNSLMKVFLWILKEAGAQDVPSFDHLRKVQKSLREKCGVPTTQYKSAKGNIFHMNDPRTIIAKDWANPETRKYIHVYPEIPTDGIIREIWHAQKWRKNMDLDNLSPMYDAKCCHYYVNEPARLTSGNLVIPIRWVKYGNVVCADAFTIEFDNQNRATIMDNMTTLISTQDLTHNYLDLQHENSVPHWSDETIQKGYHLRMPNPKRALAAGDPLYTSFIDYFGDDVSGNRSKSWNKHWNAYMTHRNLPRQLLQQEFHVHFISTSPHASITEQFTVFKSVIELTHTDPVIVRDAETHENTRFCIHGNAGPSDNPMQSEVSGHIGAKGNYMCRKCEAGGTQKEKESNECFHSLFEPGTPRSKEKILTELRHQVNLACAGVSAPIKASQTDTGIKDMYTQHWIDHLLDKFKEMKLEDPARDSDEIEAELIQWTLDNDNKIYSGFLTLKGFDPTKDTPVEILHTILLGVVKYIWHGSHTSWNNTQKEIYSLRLQSTNTDGLSIHAIRANYIMQYANSLIGRQFKTIAQTNIFHVRGIVTDEQFTTWRAVGELSALIWFPEIENLQEYCNDIRIAAGNVMDAFAVVDPTKIISKIKLHLLPHLEEDVIEFGPLIGVMTEIFECFNAIFRFCSILSNHLAPSRDIALQLADQEGLKHRLTGGWWPTPEGEWERAGPGVRAFIHTRPVLQKLVGWTVNTPAVPGSIKLLPLPTKKSGDSRPKALQVPLRSTQARAALNSADYDMDLSWFQCKKVVAAALDDCIKGSWVFAKSPLTGETIAGRIDEILDNGQGSAIIILDVFQVSAERDEMFGMPFLTRRQSEETYLIIPSTDIKFLFNAQHDCHSAQCGATGQVPGCKNRFIINTHAFHNAHLLRRALPRGLTAPIPLFEDRKAKHYELAANLRGIKDGKREESKRKREAKKAATASGTTIRRGQKKAKKSAVELAGDDESEPEESAPEDSEAEAPPRKRQRRVRTRENSDDDGGDSGSDYHGGEGEANLAREGVRRTGRTRKATKRALYEDSDLDE
ncbi:hypothetical protein C8J57DRAFT_1704630 [Mycena rebaudengoi]|nr:hypothetical protein C8J57DRAFT_1704630 [Mycena rebaudengoi]